MNEVVVASRHSLSSWSFSSYRGGVFFFFGCPTTESSSSSSSDDEEERRSITFEYME